MACLTLFSCLAAWFGCSWVGLGALGLGLGVLGVVWGLRGGFGGASGVLGGPGGVLGALFSCSSEYLLGYPRFPELFQIVWSTTVYIEYLLG